MPHRNFARPARPWAAALVLGLHGLGLLAGLWLAAGEAYRTAVATQQPLTVRLLPRPRARPDAPPPRRGAPIAPAREPSAPVLPAPDSPHRPPPSPQAIHLTVPPPPSASAPPLNLTLPRAASAALRQRHPGLDDARANTAPRTVESRIGAAMGGDDREVVEVLDDSTKRVRRGSSCLIVKRAREADLDPTMQSFRPSPALVGKC